jgi:carboxyl-terminal processing protease
VGIGIQMAPKIENNKVLVTFVYPQSPAAIADIRKGDAIVAIDHVPVAQEKSVEKVAMHIRGEKNTNVHITLERNGKWLEKDIQRQDYVLKTVEDQILDGNIGYLRIRSFDWNTVDEVRQVLSHWKQQQQQPHVSCCILDLRDNAGGYFPAGVGVASLFLPSNKVVVYTVDHRGIEETYYATPSGGIFTDGCVMILVNEHTASASELVTAALHEQRGALILGKKTFGKGVVQRVFPLSDGSGIAVTMMKYLTPSHMDIHKKGIEVDKNASCTVNDSLQCTPFISNQDWCFSTCTMDDKSASRE